MKKIKLLFLFISMNLFAQVDSFEIIGSGTDQNGCTNLVNLQFEITDYDPSNPNYYLVRKDLNFDNITADELLTITGNGIYTTGNLGINQLNKVFIQHKIRVGFQTIRHTDNSINIIHCENDLDSDGILDADDSCPTIPNTGNDLDQDGIDDACDDSDDRERNLTITDLRVFVGNTEYNVFNGAQPLLNENEEVRFVVTVSNDGDFEASSSKLDALFSVSSNAYPGATGIQVVSLDRGNAGVIQGNSSATDELVEYFSNFVGGIQLFENTPYFIFVHVDYDNDVDETDETNQNNIVVFEVRYNDTQGATGPGPITITPPDSRRNLNTDKPNRLTADKFVENKPYEVKIYSFDGVLVKKEIVSNDLDERSLIIRLEKGIYIVKTEKETYKITKL
jgi:hypothetical protein